VLGCGTLVPVDLSHPLRSLVPSLDADVLEVLAGVETALGLSQITRVAARGSRMGISHVVNRLVEHGLVLAEPGNQGHLYRLNRDHLLVPVILAGASMRKTLLDRLSEHANHLVPAPAHVSVFGSFARGEAGSDSDIDVLVVAASEADLDKMGDPLDELSTDVARWTGNHCQVVAVTASHVRGLHAGGERIVDEWLHDSYLLAGSELAALLRRPRRSSGTRSPSSPSTTR